MSVDGEHLRVQQIYTGDFPNVLPFDDENLLACVVTLQSRNSSTDTTHCKAIVSYLREATAYWNRDVDVCGLDFRFDPPSDAAGAIHEAIEAYNFDFQIRGDRVKIQTPVGLPTLRVARRILRTFCMALRSSEARQMNDLAAVSRIDSLDQKRAA